MEAKLVVLISNFVALVREVSSSPLLRERLRTHKLFTKDQCFYLNYR